MFRCYWKAKKLIREAVRCGMAAGGVIFLVGFAFGVVINKGYVDNYGDNLWAAQLWSWNQRGYVACVKAGKTTCNFHIVKPD